MEIIKSAASLITEENPFKKIELAGRTCYKSESKITDESSIKFVHNLISHKHYAMLEHAIFIFKLDASYESITKVHSSFINVTFESIQNGYIISGNLRAILEDTSPLSQMLFYKICEKYPELIGYKIVNDIYNVPNALSEVITDDLFIMSSESIDKHFYTTYRFVCDRGVSHELVRHRLCSFAQESTRYVNYGKRGFQFIEPADFDLKPYEFQQHFLDSCESCECEYNNLIDEGATPQEARAVLINAIKTEIVVTANHNEWNHMFNLRLRGTTGKPHPDMVNLMEKAYKLYAIKE